MSWKRKSRTHKVEKVVGEKEEEPEEEEEEASFSDRSVSPPSARPHKTPRSGETATPPHCHTWLRTKPGEEARQCPVRPQYGGTHCGRHSSTTVPRTVECEVCEASVRDTKAAMEAHVGSARHQRSLASSSATSSSAPSHQAVDEDKEKVAHEPTPSTNTEVNGGHLKSEPETPVEAAPKVKTHSFDKTFTTATSSSSPSYLTEDRFIHLMDNYFGKNHQDSHPIPMTQIAEATPQKGAAPKPSKQYELFPSNAGPELLFPPNGGPELSVPSSRQSGLPAAPTGTRELPPAVQEPSQRPDWGPQATVPDWHFLMN